MKRYKVLVTLEIVSENKRLAEEAVNNILSPYNMYDGRLACWVMNICPIEMEDEDGDQEDW